MRQASNLSFAQFRAAIEQERSARYRGKASIRVSCLRLPECAEGFDDARTVGLDTIFRAEGGSRHEDPKHHVQAIITQEHLNLALAAAAAPESRLLSLPYLELELPAGVELECLEGNSRLKAAKRALPASKNRWIVDVLVDDASPLLRHYVRDGLHFTRQPSDGEFFYKIRAYQGVCGESDPVFADMWLAQLSAVSKNRRDRFDQLRGNVDYLTAFDNLLLVPALFVDFQLTTIHTIIAMRCKELIIRYLREIIGTWNYICNGTYASSREALARLSAVELQRLRNIDRVTIESIQGCAPGADPQESKRLQGCVITGAILSQFSDEERQQMWARLCSATEKRSILSLATFFKDVKVLEEAAGMVKKLTGRVADGSIDSELRLRTFAPSDHTSGRCIVQVAEDRWANVDADPSDRLELAVRQLWLVPFRLCRRPRKRTRKADVQESPRVERQPNEAVFRLFCLAFRLGFQSEHIKSALESWESPRTETDVDTAQDQADVGALFLPQVYGTIHDFGAQSLFFKRRSAFLAFFGSDSPVDLTRAADSGSFSLEPLAFQRVQSLAGRQRLQNLEEALENERREVERARQLLEDEQRQQQVEVESEIQRLREEATRQLEVQKQTLYDQMKRAFSTKYEERLRTATEERGQALGQSKVLQDQVEKLKNENQALHERVRLHKTDDLKPVVDELEQKNSLLTQQLDSLRDASQNLEAKLSGCRGEIKQISSRLAEEQKRALDRQNELNEVETALNEARRQLNMKRLTGLSGNDIDGHLPTKRPRLLGPGDSPATTDQTPTRASLSKRLTQFDIQGRDGVTLAEGAREKPAEEGS